MTYVLSIKPKYVRQILAGTKKWELRTKIPNLKKGDTIVIYASAPVSRIVGEFTVGDCYYQPWRDVFNIFWMDIGINLEDLHKYVGNKKFIYMIECKNPVLYDHEVSLEKHGLKSAPQWFVKSKKL